MSQVLRQSTQVIVVVGPFVDVTDGFTPETGITLGAADEAELLKADTTTTTDISAATFAAITGCDGWYGLTLTSTHTDTVGALTVMIHDDSVCLPVFARFQVIEEAAYDTIYAASALPASTTNITAGTITTATNVTIVNGLAANVITAASMNADASAEIADAVWDEDATAHQTQGTFGQAIGDPVADTNTIYKAVVTDATGATVGVDVVAVKSDTAAILADTGTDGVVVNAASLAADAATEIANAVWDTDCTGRQTQGTFGQAIGDPVADTNTIYKAVVTDATGATVGVDVVDLKTQIGTAGAGLTAINLPDQTMNITGNITGNVSGSVGSVTAGVSVAVGGIATTSFAAGAIDAAAIAADAITSSELAQSAAQEIADEVLNRNLAGGGSGNTRNVRNALRAIRNKVSEAGGTLTITEEDDVTPAWTAAVTRTANDPISGVDPA